ncbi:MAG: dockerin type I domain-containing protein [Eubacterium sp.]|nr:dockerin type I domain-containing protein [Eubacterium sp.]
MKNKGKRFLGAVLSLVMLFSCFTFSQISASAADLNVSAAGWFESVYAEWQYVSGAGFYEVYVKSSSDSAYSDEDQLDDELIRQYDTYMRADAVGLKAGSYDIKVVAYDKEAGSVVAEKEITGLTAEAYDRSGSTFSTKSTYYSEGGVGAYNNDGTLKSDAKVIYVTAENAATVSTDVITSSKGSTTTAVGFQDIIYLYQKGYDTTPIDFRIIGTITDSDVDSFGSSAEGIQVKGKNSYALMPMTFEGIGNDAAVSGFGFLVRNAGNVEFRNFGILNCMDDGISMDTDNCNVWVHNMDFFYGQAGGDADQAKGDGTVDIKNDSQYITISYNHFWDSGKSSLCGMKSESGNNYITYHHNWFDHSDSRHPRVRTMSVHIYNNYFDGNSKYGSASAMASSLFVEQNYFRNVKYPVIIGGQGHEAGAVLSGETGTPIKMYGNIMTGSYGYTDYSVNNNDFDGYTVSSRSETIPSTISAAGGTYNNFDTANADYLGVDESDVDAAADVPAIVMADAGRCNGGDIFYTFADSTEDTNYSVVTALKTMVTNYTTSLKVIGGTVDSSALDSSAAASSATGVDGNTSYTDRVTANAADAAGLSSESDEPSANPGSTGGQVSYDLELSGSDVSSSTLTSTTTGLGTNGAYTIYATSDKSVTISGSEIRLGGGGTITDGTPVSRVIAVTLSEPGKIYVSVKNSGSVARTIAVSDGTTTYLSQEIDAGGSISEQSTDELSAGTYYIYSTSGGLNVTFVGVSYTSSSSGDVDVDDGDADETTEEETEETTEETTEDESETTTTTPVSGGDYVWNYTSGVNTLNAAVTANDWADVVDVTYNGETLTKAKKMESSTSIKFTTGADGVLTLVTYSTKTEPTIKIDGTAVSVSANGATTFDLAAGSHTITKGTASTYLYYIGVTIEGSGDDSSTTTTETPSETTTEAAKEDVEISTVEFETTLNSDTSKNPDEGEIYYTDNGDGTYLIYDQNTNRTGYLNFSFDSVSSGKVSISGIILPSVTANSWTLVQVHGTKTVDGVETAGEVFGIRTNSGTYGLRVAGGSTITATSASIAADTEASYEFIIDFDAETVELIVDGSSTGEISFADAGIVSASSIKFVTATGTRNLTLSTPVVAVYTDEEESSEATSEATTESTTETTTETPVESTTEAPVSSDAGDIDGNGKLTANDAAALLQYVISGNTSANAQWSVDANTADVDGNGTIDASDAAKILKKVLNASYSYTS